MHNPGPPIPTGTYRTIVLESNGDTHYQDYRSLPDAIRHADDAASESDDAPPVAYGWIAMGTSSTAAGTTLAEVTAPWQSRRNLLVPLPPPAAPAPAVGLL